MGRTTFYQRNYIGWPPIPVEEYNNPDSIYWEEAAMEQKFWLESERGSEATRLWLEIRFPDIEQATWKEIHDAIQSARRMSKQDFSQMLECACKPDDGVRCPVCRAEARLRELDE